MATRSHIGIKNSDGTIDYIYCHWDGYPSHNGEILVNNYTTRESINQLLDLGDLSSLDETIEKCIAYHRDKGESRLGTQRGNVLFETILQDDGVDYVYIFDNNKWECYNTFHKKPIDLYEVLYKP